MTLEDLARKIVQEQSFEFCNFEDAKMDLEIEIDNNLIRLSFDRLTTTIYSCEPIPNSKVSIQELVNRGLLGKLDREQMKCWYEYQALFWYCACNRLEFTSIIKTARPDFNITDPDGKRIGIEIIELTSKIDRQRRSIQNEIRNLTYADAEARVKKHLKCEATKFDVMRLGNSNTLFPNEATCLSDQHRSNSQDLYEKYLKYFVRSDIGTAFDEFIILGNALHSEIAITCSRDVDQILDELQGWPFTHKVGYVILFIEHQHETNKICTKGMYVGVDKLDT